MLHGVLLIALFACAAFYIGGMDWVKALSFSPMVVGIIIGMLYANSLRNNLPDTWALGIKFCSKRTPSAQASGAVRILSCFPISLSNT